MMKRILWLLLLLAAMAALLVGVHGAGTTFQLSGNPPNPPICPSCIVSNTSVIQAPVSNILDKRETSPKEHSRSKSDNRAEKDTSPKQDHSAKLPAEYLVIPASYVCQGKIESVVVEILSPNGKRLFQTDEATATFEESYVIVELPKARAKAADRYFKRGNVLQITLRTRREDPGFDEKPKDDKPRNDKDKDEKYRKEK